MSEEQAIQQTPESTFKCDECPEAFMSPAGLRVHKARIHGGEARRKKWARNIATGVRAQAKRVKALRPPKPVAALIREASNRKPRKLAFACDECDKSFDKPQALSMHHFRKHTQKGRSMKPWNLNAPKAKKLGRPRKVAADNGTAVHTPPSPMEAVGAQLVQYCPNCGFDQRALHVAMAIRVNKSGRAE